MPQPRIVAGLLAINAAANDSLNLASADGLVFSPLRLAAWRHDLTLSLLLFFDGLTTQPRSFDLTINVSCDGRELRSQSARVALPSDGSGHHWHHDRVAFQVPSSGTYVIAATVRFDDAAEALVWSQEVEITKEE